MFCIYSRIPFLSFLIFNFENHYMLYNLYKIEIKGVIYDEQ